MNKPGFSLIEILMGFALVGLVFGIGGVTLFSTMTSSRKAAAVALAKAEGQFALRSITDVIRFANSARCNTGNQLELSTGSDTVKTVNFSLATDPPVFAIIEGANQMDLVTDRVNVTVSGCPGGVMFACDPNRREVDVCFAIDTAEGIDVTDLADDAGGLLFQTGITLVNLSN